MCLLAILDNLGAMDCDDTYFYTDDDNDNSWIWYFVIFAAVIGGAWLFGGFEPSAKEKEQQQRIEQLEMDVAYLLDKFDKKRY